MYLCVCMSDVCMRMCEHVCGRPVYVSVCLCVRCMICAPVLAYWRVSVRACVGPIIA